MNKQANNGLMTIGEVAKAVGVATSVLRYYEKEGLLVPSSRSRGGYRMYQSGELDRLQFIRARRWRVGFTLEDICALLDLEHEDPKVCKSNVQHLIERRLAEVDHKMKDLKRVRGALGQALERRRSRLQPASRGRSSGECAVIKEISPKRS